MLEVINIHIRFEDEEVIWGQPMGIAMKILIKIE